MNDMAGLSLVQHDNDQLSPTLTVHDVGTQLAAAGVPRSDRQIKRYCETGFLDGARKIPGPTGEQWFVPPHAIPKLIGDLRQWQAQRDRHGQPRPAVTSSGPHDPAPVSDMDAAGHGLARPAVSDAQDVDKSDHPKPDTSAYVRQLEKRIEEKDEVIGLLKGQLVVKDSQIGDLSGRFTSLSDRFSDTQKLMGAMQRMLAPLLGQADPYNAPEKREVEAVDNPEHAQT